MQEGLTDPDDVPEPPDDPVMQRGDIYVLGEHRLMCGDSGSADDLNKLLGGETNNAIERALRYRCLTFEAIKMLVLAARQPEMAFQRPSEERLGKLPQIRVEAADARQCRQLLAGGVR